MIVSLKEILRIAEAKKYAVGSFNTPNLESVMAVIGAAEELNVPVIIMHAQIHEELIPLETIGPVMLQAAERAAIPVCVHLDHGTDLNYLKKALDLGFTSIMYDGSELEYELNFANTCIAVEMAARCGASVEAEIGTLGARELGTGETEPVKKSIYTDPDAAQLFSQGTKIDALACAFGTAHGLYTSTPKLDFERVSKIHSLIDTPLVMHGGSGICQEDYRKAIKCGIRKINYYTYMAKAGGTAVKKAVEKAFYFHDIAEIGMKAMRDNAKSALEIFCAEEK